MKNNDERSFGCPQCNGKVEVVDSRPASTFDKAAIRRRRECLSCHYRFTTFEMTLEDYTSNSKLRGMIARAMTIFRDVMEPADEIGAGVDRQD